MRKKKKGLVYSTDSAAPSPSGKKSDQRGSVSLSSQFSQEPARIQNGGKSWSVQQSRLRCSGYRIEVSKKGRRGKGVLLITGLPVDGDSRKRLFTFLKGKLACGGTLQGETVLIQGDRIDACKKLVDEWLKENHKG